MAINKNKVQLQETVLDSNGHPLASTDVNPLTSSDCVIMENGMTLEDVANFMIYLGCNEALNLDGGGSSCMLVNGEETINPSDGKQRSGVSAVALD